MGIRITYQRPDGKEAQGYLAKAGHASAPGVIVIQEWWGLQDHIKGICDRLSLAGYDALAPDLYNGKVIGYHDSEAASREMNSLNFLEATDQAVSGAARYLLESSDKVGIIGFCMGGAVTILAACRVPELSAAVCFYGLPPPAAAKPETLRVPLQAHFASRDDWCTPQTVDAFEASLKAAGKSAEIYRYEADHAFVNEQRSVHDRACAELAWGRMLDFFERNLA